MASRVTFTAGLTTLALAALTTVAPGTAHATTMFDTGVRAVTPTHSVAYRGRRPAAWTTARWASVRPASTCASTG
jgi:hypothetical protein